MKDEQPIERAVPLAARRHAMPTVAAFVDMCRAAYGADLIDQQMATAQQARREHAEILAQNGQAAASRWHMANTSRCTFFAQEGGRTLGMPLPT
jgi:hypothetical protein